MKDVFETWQEANPLQGPTPAWKPLVDLILIVGAMEPPWDWGNVEATRALLTFCSVVGIAPRVDEVPSMDRDSRLEQLGRLCHAYFSGQCDHDLKVEVLRMFGSLLSGSSRGETMQGLASHVVKDICQLPKSM